MANIELFAVEGQFATPQDFRKYLIEKVSIEEDVKPVALTVYAGTTELGQDDVRAALRAYGFEETANLGAVRRIRKPTAQGKVEAYFTQDEAGILLFYTNFRKTEDLPEIRDFLQQTRGTYTVIFPPLLLQELVDIAVTEDESTTVLSFTAKRGRESRYPAQIRPGVDRTIRYFGEDGRAALEEMSYHYGVLPTKLEMRAGKAKFRIDYQGALSIDSGKLEFPFRILERALQGYLRTRAAYDRSEFRLVPVASGTKNFEVPSSVPVAIRLEAPVQFYELPDIISLFESKEYTLYNQVAREGSLFFKAEIIDGRTGELFRLKMTDNEIRLFPEDTKDLGSFLRFYEFILDNVDPRAKVLS